MMKILFVFFAVAMTMTVSFGQTYILQNPKTTANYFDVDFSNATDGIAVSDTVIAHTTDGGISWTYYVDPYNSPVVTGGSVSMGSPTIALRSISFVSGATRDVHLTTNSGVTWTSVQDTAFPWTFAMSKKVSMFGATAAAVIGVQQGSGPSLLALQYSTDGGNNWANTTTPVNGYGPVGISMGSAQVAAAFYHGPSTPPKFGFALYTNDGGKNWSSSKFDPAMTGTMNSSISSIRMVNANVGYMAVGANGSSYNPAGWIYMIAKTTDGGQNWTRRDIITNLPAGGVLSFLNEKKGCLLYANNLWLTDDSGKTWTKKTLPTSYTNSVKYVSDSVIIVAANYGLLLRSADTGSTWKTNTAVYSGTGSSSLKGIDFSSTGVGIAVAGGTTIDRTVNKGDDWYNVSVPNNSKSSINSVKFVSDSIVIAVTDSAKFLRSTDAGLSWSKGSLGFSSSQNCLSVDFLPGTGFGVAVGTKGRFSRTFDYGATWDTLPTGTTVKLRNVVVRQFDARSIYACGDSGTVIYSLNDGVSWATLNQGMTSKINLSSLGMLNNDSVMFAIADSAGFCQLYRLSKSQDNVWQSSIGNVDPSHTVGAITILSPSIVQFYCGGWFFTTTNGGDSWNRTGMSTAVWGLGMNYESACHAVSPYDVYFGAGSSILRRIQGDYKKYSVIDFGGVSTDPILTTKDSSLKIINVGTDTLTFTSGAIVDGKYFTFVFTNTNQFPLKIAPGAIQLLPNIRFSPKINVSYDDTLILTNNGLSQPNDTIVLKGVGTSPRIKIKVVENNLDFGVVRGCMDSTETFTIKSTGVDQLNVFSLSLKNAKTPPYYFVDTTYDINAGDSVAVQVHFAPAAADTGEVRDTIKITSNASVNNQSFVSLRGYGLLPRLAITNPKGTSSLDYGNVFIGESKDNVIRFFNSGNDTLTIISVSKEDDYDIVYSFDYQPADSSKLAPQKMDSVVVRYQPTQEKTSTAKIVLFSNACQQKDSILISGTGKKKIISVDDARLLSDFSLQQNFPNPFVRYSVINYHLPDGISTGKIEVRDILGNVVYQRQVNGDDKKIFFDGSNLRSGLYEYSLKCGSSIESRIMMVVK